MSTWSQSFQFIYQLETSVNDYDFEIFARFKSSSAFKLSKNDTRIVYDVEMDTEDLDGFTVSYTLLPILVIGFRNLLIFTTNVSRKQETETDLLNRSKLQIITLTWTEKPFLNIG